MKFVSWNVNGIRSICNKGYNTNIKELEADIYCFQEIKINTEYDICLDNYFSCWNFANKKGYSGTAIFSKQKPIRYFTGIGIPEFDDEGRVLTAEFENFFMINLYSPNSKPELARLDYRQAFEDSLRNFIISKDNEKPVIICGDFNVAHNEIDLSHPTTNRRSAGFTDEERAKFSALLGSNLIDSFRYFYPDKRDSFTWWSNFHKARERNVGWRIDYFLFSKKLEKSIKDAIIYKDILGSDHCPIGLITNIIG